MRINAPLLGLLLPALMVVAGCVSTQILPQSGTIVRSLPFPDSDQMQVAIFPDGNLVTYRVSTQEDGPGFLEGYDDTLGLRWRHTVEFKGTDRELIWLANHSGKLVAVWRTRHPGSVSALASSHDPHTGQILGSLGLGLHPLEERGKYRNGIVPEIMASPDSSLLVSYTVDVPYGKGKEFDSVRVNARLFDAEMSERGRITITLPVVPMHTAENFRYRLPGMPVVDSQGQLYLATVVGPETVRVYRLDIAGGSSSSIDITTAPTYPIEERNWIQSLRLALNASGKLMVAVAELYNETTQGVTLYQLDFRTRSLDFSRVIDFNTEVHRNPDARNLTGRLTFTQMLASPEHGSLLLFEKKIRHAAPGRSIKHPSGMRYPGPPVVEYEYRGVVLIRVDTTGATRWVTIQNRPTLHLTTPSEVSDMWRLDGDSLHYMTRNVMAGAISLHDGGMPEPEQLLTTGLDGNYKGSQWIETRRALVVLAGGGYSSIVDVRY